MTTFPTGSGPLSRTYFHPRWKETCGGHRTSRGVHGILMGSRPPAVFRHGNQSQQLLVSISHRTWSTQSRRCVGVSSAARPFGRKFAWKSSWDARDPTTGRENNVLAWTARPDERWIYWFLDGPAIEQIFHRLENPLQKKRLLKIRLFHIGIL